MSEGGRTPRRFRAGPRDADRLLRDFLGGRCPELPAGFVNRLVRKGYVQVDGRAAAPDLRMKPGMRVVLRLPEGAFYVAPNPEVPFEVVHDDDALAVINKPAGVVTEPGIGHKLDTLLNGLMARYGHELDRLGAARDYGLVHRLDRETSGLLLVARTSDAQRGLVEQFRRRQVKKAYTTLVLGSPPADRGAIRLSLGRVRRRGRMRAIVGGRGSRPAVTRYRVLERLRDGALIEARPESGRWHQIRLHFAAEGMPVAGDGEHGDQNANRMLRERYGLDRLFLHAGAIRFVHPAAGQARRFEAPLPDELSRALVAMRRAERIG